MSKQDRLYLLGLVCLFVVFQVLGFLGATQGVPGTSVEYKGWAGYFIPIGAFSLILLVVFMLAIIIPAIILKVNDWIEEGKDDEANTRSEAADPPVREDRTTSVTHVYPTFRESAQDQVQGVLSRKAIRIKRELAHIDPPG